ncbi:MAG: DNA replication/repair protein RecF [Candidatus Melainabacteria bacterium]|nr:DNA replication/repair protein RecF [Candidatus Melainabacteria bacterium]
MFLKKLKLNDFRNYINFEQTFDHLKTIIIGQNAQGKSNILEAINVLATSQSERAEKDSELVFWDKDYALIFSDIQTKNSELKIALQINSTGRRKLKINDVPKKAPQADLLGNFFAVMFSCDDLYLVKGSPSARRRWLDSVLFQLDTRYHRSIQDYQKSTTQKNALLKKAQETRMPRKELNEQLGIWNEQVISLGTEIIFTRLRFIKEIAPVANEFLNNISKNTEDFGLIYKSSICEDEHNYVHLHEMDKTKIKELFHKSITESFDEELARGQSVIGPHRDDLIFLINKKEAKSFASQGQQRSIVLAVKLAELKLFEKEKDEIPVLLLDDVFAELDENRQDFLLHNLPENIQTFLTTTHISDIQKEFLNGAQVLEVKNGEIIENIGLGCKI